MDVLLWICCIFSEQHFLRTPLGGYIWSLIHSIMEIFLILSSFCLFYYHLTSTSLIFFWLIFNSWWMVLIYEFAYPCSIMVDQRKPDLEASQRALHVKSTSIRCGYYMDTSKTKLRQISTPFPCTFSM